jgi:hypothetical protein
MTDRLNNWLFGLAFILIADLAFLTFVYNYCGC